MILLSSLPETSFSLSYFRFVGMTFPTLTLCMIVYAFIGWFYESTIFNGLLQLLDENYTEYSQRSLKRYQEVNEKQELDLKELVEKIVIK